VSLQKLSHSNVERSTPTAHAWTATSVARSSHVTVREDPQLSGGLLSLSQTPTQYWEEVLGEKYAKKGSFQETPHAGSSDCEHDHIVGELGEDESVTPNIVTLFIAT